MTTERDPLVCVHCGTTDHLVRSISGIDHKPVTACEWCRANASALVRTIPVVLRAKGAAIAAQKAAS